MIKYYLLLILTLCFFGSACTKHEVEMKPIHITLDVNVRIEKAVDDFYGDIYGEQGK